jgi:hypothetical protein
MPLYLSSILINVLGLLHPSYKCFKHFRKAEKNEQRDTASKLLGLVSPLEEEDKFWWVEAIQHQMVMNVFICLEPIVDWFLYWFPFYDQIKFLFILWMVLPTVNGTIVIYNRWLVHWVERNESNIDQAIVRAEEFVKRQTAAYSNSVTEKIRETFRSLIGIIFQSLAETPTSTPAGSGKQPATPTSSLVHQDVTPSRPNGPAESLGLNIKTFVGTFITSSLKSPINPTAPSPSPPEQRSYRAKVVNDTISSFLNAGSLSETSPQAAEATGFQGKANAAQVKERHKKENRSTLTQSGKVPEAFASLNHILGGLFFYAHTLNFEDF